MDWNPKLYMKYGNERTQPSIDLVSRIALDFPKNIIDIGCGPGNSTQILVKRWPKSEITGLDNSPNMIEKAAKDFPKQEWMLANAANINISRKYDIVFSNATIQWIPDHEKLLSRLFSIVNTGGALAIQIPMFKDLAIWKAIEFVSLGSKWKSSLSSCGSVFTYHSSGYYYDLLALVSQKIEMWETTYMQIMDSHEAIFEWSKSTALRPYFDELKDENARNDFKNDIIARLKIEYPIQKSGKVIFPFKRLFFIAYK